MQLGILEQMAKPVGMSAEETARHTLDMVERAEELGYGRYWFAEHHGTRGMVSSAPEIMMAAAASRTSHIKVGSGGILLPQYSPFKVASQLAQLEALYPGRIEGGMGRSPGGAEFIRRRLADDKPNQLADYPDKLNALIQYLDGSTKVTAAPRTISRPTLHSLGLGTNSAVLAGVLGIGYVFGHFLKPAGGTAAIRAYMDAFQPGFMEEADVKACVFVICGEDDAHAERLAKTQDIWLLNTEKGLDSQIPTPEQAAEKYNALNGKERQQLEHNRQRMIIGGPRTVKDKLDQLRTAYQCDDWLILCNIHDLDEKRRSYERVAALYL